MSKPIVHLHCHTSASTMHSIDGLNTPDNLAKFAKKTGAGAIAITDHGNVAAHIAFWKACKKQGVKPILGNEFYLVPDAKTQKDQGFGRGKSFHITVLAQNKVGWHNIMKLVSISNSPGFFHYEPRIDWASLVTHKEGLIILSGCPRGLISVPFRDGDVSLAEQRAGLMVKEFGENFYFEVQDCGLREPDLNQAEINTFLRRMAKLYNRPTVFTLDAHFPTKGDHEAHQYLIGIMTARNIHEILESPGQRYAADLYLKTREECLERDCNPEEIDESQRIAERIEEFEVGIGGKHLPKIENNSNHTPIEQLRALAFKGWKQMGIGSKSNKDEYASRMKRELADIEQAGMAEYFLLVHDVVRWGKARGIPFGSGRGSAGGSLTLYLLGVTGRDLDPIQWGLVWERFYNVGRSHSFPDVDIDVAKEHRTEVIEYIAQRFGDDRVSQLITFGRMTARSVLKDVMRTHGIPFDEANMVTSLIPSKNDDHATDITLKEAFKINPKLEDARKRYPKVFEIARKLEGKYRGYGVHAAAVIINDQPFETGNLPLVRDKGGKKLICGWSMEEVDELGYLKLDILGLNELDVIHYALGLVEQRTGTKIDFEDFPSNDPKAFQMLADGRTEGIFQMRSNLGRVWCKSIKPKTVDEISAIAALIRPACLDAGMTRRYARIKNGKEDEAYIHEALRPILGPTLSVYVYQEQALQMCAMVGMTLSEADIVRKCLPKGSMILTYKNGYQPIEKIMSLKDKRVYVIDPYSGTPHIKKIYNVFQSGRKKIWQLTTKTGHILKVTGDHQIYIGDRWVALKHTKPGDMVAVCEKTLTQGNSKISDDKIIIATLMASEGYLPKTLKNAYFCNTDPQLISMFQRAFLSLYGYKCKQHVSNGVTYCRIRKNEAKQLCRLVYPGLSGDKAFTNYVLNSSIKKVCKLLGLYLSCDGWMDKQGIHYGSKSILICQQIKRLLLRLGVVSSIHGNEHYIVSVTSTHYINILFNFIRGELTKYKRDQYISIQQGRQANCQYSGIPTCIVKSELNNRIKSSNRSMRNLGIDSLHRLNGKICTKHSVSSLFCSERLDDLQNGSLIWDQIDNIKEMDYDTVYDFTMLDESMPYAVVEDFLVHNCIGKKKPELLKEQESIFIDKAHQNGFAEIAQQLWNYIKDGAGYGFNRSHSIAYSLLSYKNAFLKANYPHEFFCANMVKCANLGDKQKALERIKELINDAKITGIRVTPPSIRECNIDFEIISQGAIAFGLSHIHGVGAGGLRAVAECKGAQTFYDFLRLAHKHRVNRRVMEGLIRSGACDVFGMPRKQMELEYTTVQELPKRERDYSLEKITDDGLLPLVEVMGDEDTVDDRKTKKEFVPNINRRAKLRELYNQLYESSVFNNDREWNLQNEHKYLGCPLSGNFEDVFTSLPNTGYNCLDTLSMENEEKFQLCVQIDDVRVVHTKKDRKPMAFLSVSDKSYGLKDVVVFPKTYAKYGELLVSNSIVRLWCFYNDGVKAWKIQQISKRKTETF